MSTTSGSRAATRIAAGTRKLLGNPLLHPLNDVEAINDFLGQTNPLWSLNRVKARLIKIVQETPDARSFMFQTNRLWNSHRAGQHVVLELEIKGVRTYRTYTVSSQPARDKTFSITVKRQPGGKVSNWLHDQLRPGDIINVSLAAGDFVLPAAAPDWLLLLSAGSGITPVMSMLRQLLASDYAGHVVFLHICRTRQDEIFGAELRRLASEWSNLELRILHDSETGLVDAALLKKLVPDYALRSTYLCGPPAFMQMVRELWTREGLSERLAFEYFGTPPARTGNAGELKAEILCARSGTQFETRGVQPLLVEAENAGLKPAYGCRIGICRTCQCRKKSGTVENLLTGAISSEPNQVIQLCVSAARSNIELDL